MKDIVIVGAGGFGRELYYMIKEINSIKPTWNIKGFIAGDHHELDGVDCACPIVGIIEEWMPQENEVFAMGISSPSTKERLAKYLKNKGANFVTIVSPHARINETVKMGEGCVVSPSSSIGDGTVLGNFVHIEGSMIGQDVRIGDFTTSTGFVNIPNTSIGKRVFIGSHSVVLAKVEDDAKICAGSIVFRKVRAQTTVAGNPAKRISFE